MTTAFILTEGFKPTELNQVVDCEKNLHLSGQWLDGRGSVVLVDVGEALGRQETTLEQRADQYFTDITSEPRQRTVTCVNERQRDAALPS